MTAIPSPAGMPAPPGVPAAAVDSAGFVAADVPCRKCGYNLRGLAAVGRCPECAAAVGLSVLGDLLRYSTPTWVRTLQRGARFIIYGVATIVLGAIAGVVLTLVLGAAGAVVLGAVAVVGYVLVLLGWWQLTEPDPSGLGEDQYGTARKIIRVALVLGVINQLITILPAVTAVPPALRVAIETVNFAIGIVSVVGLIAQLQYLKKISLRIPDDKLAGRADFLVFALGVTYGLLIIVGVTTRLLVDPAGPTNPALGAVGCFGGLLGLTLLVFLVMYLLLIERLGRRFGEEAAAAEQSWARADAAASAAARLDPPAPPPPQGV